MAFVVGVPARKSGKDASQLKWYAVLYQFDSDGNHLSTKSHFLGFGEFAHELRAPEQELKEMVAGLKQPVTFGDIEINLFSTLIDGSRFGLIDASEPSRGYFRVDLIPNGLSFFSPWEGAYST